MLKVIFSILISMLAIIVVMFGQLLGSTKVSPDTQESITAPRYHMQFLIQDSDEYFWNLFQKGVRDAAREHNVYPEFVEVAQRDILELEAAVEMGVYAGVDGIALTAADSSYTQQIIEKAEARGVSVITYENDNYILHKTPVVGTNSYSLGFLAGEMAIEASNANANVALIIHNSGEDSDVQYKNMIVQGVLESFSKYSTINLRHILTIDSDLFEVEKLTSEIIDNYDDVNLIICMDERSTPGAAQVLVDNNMVGDIKLIGYGVMPQTLDYIRKGVIYGTVCPDAYEIGYMTVQQLYKALEGEQISDSINTDLYIINAANVDEYKLITED